MDGTRHTHDAPQPDAPPPTTAKGGGRILSIRPHSGLSGDMFLAGLLRLAGLGPDEIDARLAAILPELTGCVRLEHREVGHIGGWHAAVRLPRQHTHRTLADIAAIIGQSGLAPAAKDAAQRAFSLIARAEGAVHGVAPEAVHFHEVGALDSITDICLACEVFTLLAPERLVVGPLPLADGGVACAHGVIPTPCPAVLEMLEGIPVRPFPAEGETVTPTALALLRALHAEFGPWPRMVVERHALAYGDRTFDGAPNGALFILGTAWKEPGADASPA